MIVFKDDDAAFDRYRRKRSGYILNCHKNPSPRYLRFHLAICREMQRDRPAHGNTWTRGDYQKIGGRNLDEFREFAREVGGSLLPCLICNPFSE